MLSYRHGYHAGNPADVLKHAVFCQVLSYLQQKEKPLTIIDTHAGGGVYDLESERSAKTAEFEQGVATVWPVRKQAPALMRPFFEQLHQQNQKQGAGRLRYYSGTAALAAQMRRPQDRVQLSDLHPSEYKALVAALPQQRQVQLRQEDGLKTLLNKLPPSTRRALVVIDPSYEVKADYHTVASSVEAALKRFSSGTYMVWYPVASRANTEMLLRRLSSQATVPYLRVELQERPDSAGRGMTASGLWIANPPWSLASELEPCLAWLKQTLQAHAVRLDVGEPRTKK